MKKSLITFLLAVPFLFILPGLVSGGQIAHDNQKLAEIWHINWIHAYPVNQPSRHLSVVKIGSQGKYYVNFNANEVEGFLSLQRNQSNFNAKMVLNKNAHIPHGAVCNITGTIKQKVIKGKFSCRDNERSDVLRAKGTLTGKISYQSIDF